jgi:hypothetical protein
MEKEGRITVVHDMGGLEGMLKEVKQNCAGFKAENELVFMLKKYLDQLNSEV